MPAVEHLSRVAEQLGTLGGVAERHFTAIGHSLEKAVGILAGLTSTFQGLLGDLRGSELAQSGQDLAAAAAHVGTLADASQADVATIRQLASIVRSIDGCIGPMDATLREVDILAMNARLVATTMGETGAGFLPFATEIRRSAGTARGGLGRFVQELAGARQHLGVAAQATEAFVAQHTGTMQSITGRLGASVKSIEAHVRQSDAAASAAGARSDEIRSQVAAAIVALQLGDITRQRIEHMQSACELLSQETAPSALACRLVAAQLLDVADELEQGAGCIIDELHELATDAGEIARQGTLAHGTSAQRSGSFLDELEADTRQAQILFEHLGAAHATVNPRITAVLRAASGLVSHVAMIRSVEADIHIMGLNTSLKCGRLGVAGRPLSVISLAVRDCGRQTAQHAATVRDALQHLLAAAGTLAAAGSAQGVDVIDATAQRMTGAVRHLGGIAERMAAALVGLALHGEEVAQLMHTAVEGFAVRHEIGAVLRGAAALCTQRAGQAADAAIFDAVLARIAASYTMARERMVHARFVPLQAAGRLDAPAPATADAEIADMLF